MKSSKIFIGFKNEQHLLENVNKFCYNLSQFAKRKLN